MVRNYKLKGLDWLEPLNEAYGKRLVVAIQYKRFDRMDKDATEWVVESYQMRHFNN